jgi:hypothetical protein
VKNEYINNTCGSIYLLITTIRGVIAAAKYIPCIHSILINHKSIIQSQKFLDGRRAQGKVTHETSGSHSGENEDGCFLGCSTFYSGRSLPMFQRCLMLPISSRKHL